VSVLHVSDATPPRLSQKRKTNSSPTPKSTGTGARSTAQPVARRKVSAAKKPTAATTTPDGAFNARKRSLTKVSSLPIAVPKPVSARFTIGTSPHVINATEVTEQIKKNALMQNSTADVKIEVVDEPFIANVPLGIGYDPFLESASAVNVSLRVATVSIDSQLAAQVASIQLDETTLSTTVALYKHLPAEGVDDTPLSKVSKRESSDDYKYQNGRFGSYRIGAFTDESEDLDTASQHSRSSVAVSVSGSDCSGWHGGQRQMRLEHVFTNTQYCPMYPAPSSSDFSPMHGHPGNTGRFSRASSVSDASSMYGNVSSYQATSTPGINVWDTTDSDTVQQYPSLSFPSRRSPAAPALNGTQLHELCVISDASHRGSVRTTSASDLSTEFNSLYVDDGRLQDAAASEFGYGSVLQFDGIDTPSTRASSAPSSSSSTSGLSRSLSSYRSFNGSKQVLVNSVGFFHPLLDNGDLIPSNTASSVCLTQIIQENSMSLLQVFEHNTTNLQTVWSIKELMRALQNYDMSEQRQPSSTSLIESFRLDSVPVACNNIARDESAMLEVIGEDCEYWDAEDDSCFTARQSPELGIAEPTPPLVLDVDLFFKDPMAQFTPEPMTEQVSKGGTCSIAVTEEQLASRLATIEVSERAEINPPPPEASNNAVTAPRPQRLYSVPVTTDSTTAAGLARWYSLPDRWNSPEVEEVISRFKESCNRSDSLYMQFKQRRK
jgi:hypothetical protein